MLLILIYLSTAIG